MHINFIIASYPVKRFIRIGQLPFYRLVAIVIYMYLNILRQFLYLQAISLRELYKNNFGNFDRRCMVFWIYSGIMGGSLGIIKNNV